MQRGGHIIQKLAHVLVLVNEKVIAFVVMKEELDRRVLLPHLDIVISVSVVALAEKAVNGHIQRPLLAL